MTGTVVKSTGSWYVVRDHATQQLHRCRLRGRFKHKGLKVSNPLAVGGHPGAGMWQRGRSDPEPRREKEKNKTVAKKAPTLRLNHTGPHADVTGVELCSCPQPLSRPSIARRDTVTDVR